MPHGLTFVAAKVVHDHHVARAQGRNQHAFDIGAEDVAIDRTIEHPWGVDPVMT